MTNRGTEQMSLRIAIIGDFNENKHTHLALNEAVEHCKARLPDADLHATWIATDSITSPESFQKQFNGLWIAPGSPYQNDEAVYETLQWSRENNFPTLGTCGGFQYMVVEYARNVLDIADATHEESEPATGRPVIHKLSCSLKGQQEMVHIPDRESWLYQVLQKDAITGFFNCSYGVNEIFQKEINQPPFAFIAFSENGQARAFELKGHRFYKGTLFQPPLDSTPAEPNALLLDFFKTCIL